EGAAGGRFAATPGPPTGGGFPAGPPPRGRERRRPRGGRIRGGGEPPPARPVGGGSARRCAHVEAGRCTSSAIAVAVVDGEPRHRVVCVRAAELPAWRRRSSAVLSEARRAAVQPILGVHHPTKVYEPPRRR